MSDAYYESQRERRHRERMELEKKKLRLERSRRASRRVRTMLRDEKGRFIAREVIEEYDDDEDEDL